MAGIAPYKRTLAAGERTTIDARGTTIFVRQTTEELSVTARSAQVGEASGQGFTIRMTASEKWFTADEFDQVVLVNEGSASTDVEILIGYGDFFRPVPDIVNVAIDVPASRALDCPVDHTNIDIGAAGIQLIHAENLSRIRLVVTALATNTDAIRVGNIDVDTNRGIPLAAGESVAFETTAAIYACSETADDQAAAHVAFIV